MILFCLLSAALAAPVSVDSVLRAALSRDPSLAAAQAELLGAEGQARAATGIRQDPTLSARAGFGLAQHELALTQPLSLSGEGAAARRVADADLRAATAALDHRRLEVAAEARRSLIRASAAQSRFDLATEALHLQQALRLAAEQRLQVGEAAELEAHLARLEEAAAAAACGQAQRELLAARKALAQSTGLAADVELPGDPMAAVPADAAPAERADRAAAAARVEAAAAASRMARAAALPPVELGIWAQVQNVAASPSPSGVVYAPWSAAENVAWTIGPSLSLVLPIWNANRGAVALADADRDLARSRQASLEAGIAADQAGNAGRRASLAWLKDAVDPGPEARSALAALDAAVEQGELGRADAALHRARVLELWGRATEARAEAAETAIDLALAEAWHTLLPAP